jgi:transposase
MPDSVSVDPLQRFRLILDNPEMRELSVAEQRYQAVMAVISDGLSVSRVAEKVGVSRQTLHTWLARYEASGLEGWWIGRIGRCRVRIRCRPRSRSFVGIEPQGRAPYQLTSRALSSPRPKVQQWTSPSRKRI